MSHIFISYANEDRIRVQYLVSALESEGWTIWWDRQIPAGKTFDQVISQALDEARCVIVVWSSSSVKSNWVREEAETGLKRGILVPVLIDRISPPMGFGRIQAADLIDWQGSASSLSYQNLARDIALILDSPSTTGVFPADSIGSSDADIHSKWNSSRNIKVLPYVACIAILIVGLMFSLNYIGNRKPYQVDTVIDNTKVETTPKSQLQGASDTVGSNVEASSTPNAINLLLANNGGQVLAATSESWLNTIDGIETYFRFYESNLGGKTEAVYAFKDERLAEFDTFTVLILDTRKGNIKDFELLWGNESVTGMFYSIGRFQTQNIKLLKTPFQQFKFPVVTAKYLKVRLLSTWEYALIDGREFQLMGTLK